MHCNGSLLSKGTTTSTIETVGWEISHNYNSTSIGSAATGISGCSVSKILKSVSKPRDLIRRFTFSSLTVVSCIWIWEFPKRSAQNKTNNFIKKTKSRELVSAWDLTSYTEKLSKRIPTNLYSEKECYNWSVKICIICLVTFIFLGLGVPHPRHIFWSIRCSNLT